jgi:hypothetical protein
MTVTKGSRVFCHFVFNNIKNTNYSIGVFPVQSTFTTMSDWKQKTSTTIGWGEGGKEVAFCSIQCHRKYSAKDLGRFSLRQRPAFALRIELNWTELREARWEIFTTPQAGLLVERFSLRLRPASSLFTANSKVLDIICNEHTVCCKL